jgi:hypothetical protein
VLVCDGAMSEGALAGVSVCACVKDREYVCVFVCIYGVCVRESVCLFVYVCMCL